MPFICNPLRSKSCLLYTSLGVKEDVQKTVVTGIEMFRKQLDEAQAGDNIGALPVSYTHLPLLTTEAPVVGTGIETKAAVDSGVCVVAKADGEVLSSCLLYTS